MTDDAPARKARLRREVRVRIGRMPDGDRAGADRRIAFHLSGLTRSLGASFVLGYLAMADEVRIDGFLAAAVESGIAVLLPRVSGTRLMFGEWRPSCRLERDDHQVLAPHGGLHDELPQGCGLIVAPGRAFDLRGGRLGRGGGYYDLLLAVAASGNRAVGVGYDCQLVDAVPREAHDRKMDVIVTEAGPRAVRPLVTP